MPIILPEDDELDARTLAILHVATLIEDAMTGRKPVDLYDLTGEIVDHLQPPVRLGTNDPLDRVDAALNALEASNVTISEDALALLDSTEPGAAAARLRELADLIEHCGAYAPPKPRIRVRAATRRGAE